MGLFDRFKKTAAPAEDKILVAAPVAGELVQLSETTEPVFSSEMMGKGVAINPTVSVISAPVAGTVSAVMPHAIGLMTDSGIEVLIHVGIDTVEMKGEGFEPKVARGDSVKAGDEVLAFSREKIAEDGHADTVFVIVTNTADCESVDPVTNRTVAVGDTVLTVTK